MSNDTDLIALTLRIEEDYADLCRAPSDRAARARFERAPERRQIFYHARLRNALWLRDEQGRERFLYERTDREKALLHRETARRFSKARDKEIWVKDLRARRTG